MEQEPGYYLVNNCADVHYVHADGSLFVLLGLGNSVLDYSWRWVTFAPIVREKIIHSGFVARINVKRVKG